MIPIVSIVGGEATRLYPLTINKPKFMLEIEGKPFIGYQLDLFKKNGIMDVVLCTGRLGEQIQEYVKDGSAWGLNVKYAPEGPTPLGTGGTVKKAMPILPEDFFVIQGDMYIDVDYSAVYEQFKASGKDGLMTVWRNKDQLSVNSKSNILYQNKKIVKYEKKYPTPEFEHIDYGLYVFKKSVFKKWPETFDLADLFMDLVKNDQFASFEVYKRYYSIGNPYRLNEFTEYVRSTK